MNRFLLGRLVTLAWYKMEVERVVKSFATCTFRFVYGVVMMLMLCLCCI